jgi:hypothetical protein
MKVDGSNWHECEVPQCLLLRRYWEISGSDADIVKPT